MSTSSTTRNLRINNPIAHCASTDTQIMNRVIQQHKLQTSKLYNTKVSITNKRLQRRLRMLTHSNQRIINKQIDSSIFEQPPGIFGSAQIGFTVQCNFDICISVAVVLVPGTHKEKQREDEPIEILNRTLDATNETGRTASKTSFHGMSIRIRTILKSIQD